MKDVRIDTNQELRCWNCGSKGFTAKRTTRSKVLVGVGALVTKKKLKCQACGEYNDTGSAKPWDGPADKRYCAAYQRELERSVRDGALVHGGDDSVDDVAGQAPRQD